MSDPLALELGLEPMTNNEFVSRAGELANLHAAKATWYGRKPEMWVCGLMEELGELAEAIQGDHEHPPQLELMQIIACAINMHRRFYATRELGANHG